MLERCLDTRPLEGEQLPVSAGGRGFVAAVVKNHGDTVVEGDCILLTTWEKDTILLVAELRLDHLLRAAARTTYIPSHVHFVAFAVKSGQSINQSDALATVVVSDKPVVLTSPYSGVVAAIGDFKDGRDLSSHRGSMTVAAIDCSRATYPIEAEPSCPHIANQLAHSSRHPAA